MKKILILLLMIFLAGTVSAAVDIMDFKSPDGFDAGYGGSMSYNDYSITIEPYEKNMDQDVFESDNFKNVTTNGNFTKFDDEFHEQVGVFEIIQIGKEQYLVKCIYDDRNTSQWGNCLKYLKEFNEKNNLTAITPEKLY